MYQDITTRKNLLDSVIKHERFRARVYDDATGKTILPNTLVIGTPTIGFGTNLVEGIDQDIAELLLQRKLQQSFNELERIFGDAFLELTETKQDVLIEMVYNLGLTRFLKFEKFLQAVFRGDYLTAAHEMLWNDSAKTKKTKWYEQVGERAETLAQKIQTN